MKKLILAIVLLASTLCSSAFADVFGPRHGQPAQFETSRLKAPRMEFPAADDVLSNIATIIGALGAKEGTFYDFDREEFYNYLAATIVTFDPTPISIDLGILNKDKITPAGGALSANWNIGDVLPVENVPLIKYFKYAYIGAGLGLAHETKKDDTDSKEEWRWKYGFTGFIKMVW